MAKFLKVGNRIVNLDLIAAAEREGRAGKVTVHLAAPAGTGTGGLTLVFEDQHEADVVWLKLNPDRGDLADLRGGPYAISDNEATASESGRARAPDRAEQNPDRPAGRV